MVISQLTFANLAISRLAEESDLILKGKVIETQPFSSASGYDMIATIKIENLLKGSWNDSIIEVPYYSLGLHRCETYYLNEELIGFLKTRPSIKAAFGNHGKITLKGRLQDSLTTFLKVYLRTSSENERINLILDYISIGPDYSFLSLDLLLIKKRLLSEQQFRVIKIVKDSDSLLANSRFTQSDDIYERQPYRILDYYDMLLVLRDSDLKYEAVAYLGMQLERESSNFLARSTIAIICQLTRHRRKCQSILKEYDEENQWSDGTDSINDNSQKLINQLIEEIKN
jgi:hypothetical protein